MIFTIFPMCQLRQEDYDAHEEMTERELLMFNRFLIYHQIECLKLELAELDEQIKFVPEESAVTTESSWSREGKESGTELPLNEEEREEPLLEDVNPRTNNVALSNEDYAEIVYKGEESLTHETEQELGNGFLRESN